MKKYLLKHSKVISGLKSAIFAFAVFALAFLPTSALQAAGISITYPGQPGALFNSSNLVPGDIIERVITVTNNETTPQRIAFRVKEGPSGSLADKITLEVKKDAITLAGPQKLKTYYGFLNETELEVLSAGATAQYRFIATLDRDMGNEFQGKSEVFDLSLGFIATDAPDDTPPQEEDTPPTIIENIVAFFGGLLPALPAPTPEVAGEVAGDVTPEPEEVRGDIDEGGVDAVAFCPWWWIVLAVLALSLVIYYAWEARHEQRKLWWVVPIILTVIAVIVHFYFHRFFEETVYCDWVWLFALIILAVMTAGYLLLRKEGKEK